MIRSRKYLRALGVAGCVPFLVLAACARNPVTQVSADVVVAGDTSGTTTTAAVASTSSASTVNAAAATTVTTATAATPSAAATTTAATTSAAAAEVLAANAEDYLDGGAITLVSSDDGLNAAGDGTHMLTMNGGTFVVTATGDGVDVNGSVTMSGGTIIVNEPTTSGNGALDYDGTWIITGGLVVATGSSGMAMAPTGTSDQKPPLAAFAAQAAGTLVHIEATTGTDVATFRPTNNGRPAASASRDVT